MTTTTTLAPGETTTTTLAPGVTTTTTTPLVPGETTTTTLAPGVTTTTTTPLVSGETTTTTVPGETTATTSAPGETSATTTTTIPDPPLLVAGMAPAPPSGPQADSDSAGVNRAPLERIMGGLMTSVEVIGSPALSSVVLTGLVVWLSMRGLEGSPADGGEGRRRRWASRGRRRR